VQTGGKPVARNFRLKLDLVHTGGRWLTSDLEFVG
jgi:Mce-associated membrane protein